MDSYRFADNNVMNTAECKPEGVLSKQRGPRQFKQGARAQVQSPVWERCAPVGHSGQVEEVVLLP